MKRQYNNNNKKLMAIVAGLKFNKKKNCNNIVKYIQKQIVIGYKFTMHIDN